MLTATWILLDARIVDALGERTVEALVVENGRIAHMGALEPQHADLPAIEAEGATVVPGLVDGHVHLSMTPGGAFLELSRDEELDLWRHHLRAYVASGVVAVLDTGILPDDARAMDAIAAAGPAPEIRYLGPLVSPPGGYVSAVLPAFPPAATPADLEAQLVAFDALDPIGVKVTMEDGMLRPIWPFHGEDVMEALRAQPRPLFVHAMEPREFERALTLRPRAFVHPPDDVDDQLVAALADIPVMTTLSAFDSLLVAVAPERLDDPLIRLTVPEVERRAAADPETIRRSSRAVVDVMAPKLPGFVRAIGAQQLERRGPIERRMAHMTGSVVALHEAGVTLVLGSDSGNWPVFLFEFHGPTTVRELELLQGAGIPPADALRIATLNGAELLGLGEELGTIEVGKRASFLVVDGDPLADVGVLRSPRWVVLDGERRTPAEWMR